MQKRSEFFTKSVKRNSKIILYGAGNYGRKIWEENSKFKWCNILMVIDKYPEKCTDFPTEVTRISSLCEFYDYDVVVVSVRDSVCQKEIINSLIAVGVPYYKITTEIEQEYYLSENISVEDNAICINEGTTLRIGIYYRLWALGDQIIGLKIYQALCDMFDDCIIDVFSLKKVYSETVFYNQKKLRKIIEKEPDKSDWKKYDLFIDVSAQLLIKHICGAKIKAYSPDIYKKIVHHIEYQKERFVETIETNYVDAIILGRTRLKGGNKFTSYADSGFLEIYDRKVAININTEYKNEFDKLKLPKKYITFNYGACGVNKEGPAQIKMWPEEYHARLNHMIKKMFPDLTIVQLGGNDSLKIDGADEYIFGFNLEISKYILKNALFHYDCEGGLVHMATQLGTKCFVLFGPTPIWYYGYDQNTNIAPRVCGECMGLIRSWFDCYVADKPLCMQSIKPDDVFQEICKYINNLEYELY